MVTPGARQGHRNLVVAARLGPGWVLDRTLSFTGSPVGWMGGGGASEVGVEAGGGRRSALPACL